MNIIHKDLVKKVQSMIVKAKHAEFTWEEVNQVLFALHKLDEIPYEEPKHGSDWKEMESVTPMEKVAGDTGKTDSPENS